MSKRLVRHFSHESDADVGRLFRVLPEQLPRSASATEVGSWLGAALYMPASRVAVAADVVRARAEGVQACIIDFEDALGDVAASTSVERALHIVGDLEEVGEVIPLIFLRFRSPVEIDRFSRGVGRASTVTSGFVLPKFDPLTNGEQFLDAVAMASEHAAAPMLCMPVIEALPFAFRETRGERLEALEDLIQRNTERVAGLRLGVTDLASAFGLRRTADSTVYDIRVVADVVTDVVNRFGRSTGMRLPIAGPVWEHLDAGVRFLKPRLREAPFDTHDARPLRHSLVASGQDALIAEITLDKLNGLEGKSVIHPRHAPIVHALSVVTSEEYDDALHIVSQVEDGGAHRSPAGNKMNEVRPHLAWAKRLLHRSRVFGVALPEIDFVDFLLTAEDRST